MTIYRLPQAVPMALPDGPIALALGNFDGVHEGHRRLLCAAREAARAIPGCLCGAWTFTSLAKAGADTPALTTTEEKLRQFAEAGLDFAILVDFSAVRNLSPEQFVREHLIAALHCAAVVCGFNFRFGYRGAGTSSDLSRLLAEANVPLTVIDPVTHEDTPVSSTRIREEKLIGQSYLQQLRRGELVSWKTLDTICALLECQPGDLIEFQKEE